VKADDADFDEFYLRCRDRLVLQVAAVCGDPSEAMDHVQEAFIRAWSAWERIGKYEDPEGWVRRVANNRAIGRWRRARRLVPQSEHDLARHDLAAIDLLPGQNVAITALQTLPVDQRRALVLHHVVGLSVAEVSAEMSAPEGTVKSWLARGRIRLAAALTAEGELSNDNR
jgi:RNA polymerase sigma factor (sigma-70 family)